MTKPCTRASFTLHQGFVYAVNNRHADTPDDADTVVVNRTAIKSIGATASAIGSTTDMSGLFIAATTPVAMPFK